MNIEVAYIYPTILPHTYTPLARRFADSWRSFPPKSPAHLTVVCNGAPPKVSDKPIFDGLPFTFMQHSNFGQDVGAFQFVAAEIPCDLLVCLGAPVHFHKPGWLELMRDAFLENGPALYGCWAYLSPGWHVRTTVFWFPPELLQAYPWQITSSKSSRYDFEYGPNSFTRHCLKNGFECYMVTRKGCFPFSEWEDNAPGVEDSLVLDQHTHP